MINEPNANNIMSLKRQFLKILNTDLGILLLEANTALYISNMNDALSYFELFDDANEILFKSIDNWNLIMQNNEECMRNVITHPSLRDRMGLYMPFENFKMLIFSRNVDDFCTF